MTAVRLVPLPIHAALRLATGLLTMAAPFLAGFGVLATLLAIVVGSIVVGLSLTATPDERGRTALPATVLHALDWASVLVMMVVAAAVSVSGDAIAGSVLLAIGAAQVAGNLTTSYDSSARA